jgi:hypothetical protein
MKTWCKQILLAVFVTICASLGVSAQDAGMSDGEIRTSTESEKAVFSPGEDVRFVPRATGVVAPHDSVSLQIQDFPMQRAAQRPAEKSGEKQPAKKDDSILTYNFLYYIIQKYKLQDIID